MKFVFSCLLVAAVLLASCSTLEVSTDYNPGFNFASLKTYEWLPQENPATSDIRINNSLINDRVTAAVENNLDAKGFRKATEGTPDFYVTWLGAIDQKMRIDTINQYYGSYGYGGCCWPGYARTYISEYEEGTLIIDILNPVDHKLLWRGTGRDYIREMQTPEEITRNINEVVVKILAGFPPGKSAPYR
jgi:hypothetical protein